MSFESSGPILKQRLSKAIRKTTSPLQAKSVHRFRTTVRRIEAALRYKSGDFTKKQEFSLTLLSDARKLAGKVRDVDVQLALLSIIGNRSIQAEKQEIATFLREKRGRTEKKLSRALEGLRKEQVVPRLSGLLAATQVRVEANALADAEKRLQKLAKHFTKTLGSRQLHKFRNRLKRVRYTAELSPASPYRDAFITSLKEVQDAIGDWHDHETLRKSAEKRIRGQSALLSELRALEQTRFTLAEHRLSSLLLEYRVDSQAKKPASRQSETATVLQHFA